MTKKERVIAAIEQREIDGVPSSFLSSFPGRQEAGRGLCEGTSGFLSGTRMRTSARS